MLPIASYYHYDVILIMKSFATELATASVMDIRTPNYFWTRNVGQCPTWWSPCRT